MSVRRLVLPLVPLLVALAPVARADVKLPAIFGSHMVLQEGRPVPLWGSAAPGEAIAVSAAGQEQATKADADGRWRVTLQPLEHRDPFTVTIKGASQSVTFDDVVTGEVWVGSGQSNMEMQVGRAKDADAEIERAPDAKLRLFLVRHGARLPRKADDVDGRWLVCDRDSVATFSAVLYFFGRELRRELGVPVGLIDTSWGGTPAEAWMRRSALTDDPQLRVVLGPDGVKGPDEAKVAADAQAYEQRLSAWEKANRQEDPGNDGEAQGWGKPGIPEAGWSKIAVPGHWEETAKLAIDGAVWFRKEVVVPPDWAGQPVALHLGVVNDCDVTYVGGERIGGTCGQPAQALPRVYDIPPRLVRAGRLLVAVRVFDERGSGGFSSPPGSLHLARGEARLPLAGSWNYRVERSLPPVTVRWDERPQPPPSFPDPFQATHLWNQLVAPMVPFAIRGVTWYQGEANVDRAYLYRRLFPALIRDWRKGWGQGEFPFLFVQLANFHERWPGPGHKTEDEWPELREAQAMTLAAVPNTGMAVTIDVGDRDDIHPTNKQEVGRRLSLWALAKTYGKSVPAYAGPRYASHTIGNGQVRVKFRDAAGLKTARAGAPLMGFEVAGADRRFVHARAVIEGDVVIVSAPNVKAPVAVRYDWTDSPVGNFVDGQGLPASPFRTDTWPGLTVSNKRPIPTR